MTPIVVVLTIQSEPDPRGKPHATADATTDNPDYDVAIVSAAFVHGSRGAIGADLAVKVAPKDPPTPMSQPNTAYLDPSHPIPPNPLINTVTAPYDDTQSPTEKNHVR